MNLDDFDLEGFLSENPVPFHGTPQWEEWQERCNRLPPEFIPRVINVLKHGPEFLHYQCMMILRMRKFKTGQTGEGNKTVYELVHPNGDIVSFTPDFCPPVYNSLEDFENSGDSVIKFKKNES